jgi:hypothetical protein
MEQASQRRARRIAAAFICLLAIVLLGDRLVLLRYGLESPSWPVAAGVITSVDARPIGGGRAGGSWTLKIEYQYQVGQVMYQGRRIRFTRSLGARSELDVDQALSRFQPGYAINVHHHPRRPGVSVIEPGADRSGWLGLIVSLLLFVVAAVFWLVPTRRHAQRAPQA